MATSMSKEAYQSLLEMIGRAFYNDIGFEQRRFGATTGYHNHGILVVILDHFGRRQCWKSVSEVAKALRLSKSQVQEAVGFLEEEKMLVRVPEKGTQAYCYALNNAEIYSVITYKLQKMKASLESKHTVAEYLCRNCDRRYTALDAASLLSGDGERFECESCQAELESESERIRELLLKFEEQMAPLNQQLERVKNLPPPELENPWRVKKRARSSP